MDPMLLAALLLGPPSQEAAQPPADGPIVVTGERGDGSRPELPYPEAERVPVGSRIARRSERRTFRTVATDQGLAGLISAPGNDFDASGGAVPAFRNRRVTECVAGHPQVSEATACALFRVRQHLTTGDFAAAAERIEPLLRNRTLSGIDRYYVARINYELALAADDDARLQAALSALLESRHLEAANRAVAQRALAAISARRDAGSPAGERQ